eukprot:TRINITY_DN114242_c0_g1_i1.p1 TRINITY_DN114242_c0_g1~~TRINITY_DN114242_c0_g1_i1.p1  ORF type:complete len:196 (-),score=34.51 TRINITY_DN114242_c0_g1_i1:169-756(-)
MVVVVANTEEEQQAVREEILEKSQWLKRLNLHKDGSGLYFEDEVCVADEACERSAAAELAATAAEAESCREAIGAESLETTMVAAQAWTMGAVDADSFIVVRSVLPDAVKAVAAAARDQGPEDITVMDLFERLLDVPDASALTSCEDLAVVSPASHPDLCERLRRFLDDVDADTSETGDYANSTEEAEGGLTDMD